MDEICELEFREAVTVDPDRLVELCVSMGELQAEGMITTAVEELARGMVDLDAGYSAQNLQVMEQRANVLAKTAQHIGMVTFARVAEDVADCARVGHWLPLAATVMRLRRIADRSLNAVWEMQDISV